MTIIYLKLSLGGYKKLVVKTTFSKGTAYLQFYEECTSSRRLTLQFPEFFQIPGKTLGMFRV